MKTINQKTIETIYNSTQAYWYLAILSFVSFFIPFILGHPQLLVGIVVNTALVVAALRLRMIQTIPIIILPSIATILRGLLFGPYSTIVVMMIPFIWAGNLVFVLLIKLVAKKIKQQQVKTNVRTIQESIKTITVLASIKAAVISTGALFLVLLNVMPVALIVAFSIMQLITAGIGASIGLALQKILP
ncbi:hypothetical protein K9M74_02770 [Candidatus Woesearchaeota archaeon]|nr:hypothetical protein [Candidatus Woesearchaeota archaeon]